MKLKRNIAWAVCIVIVCSIVLIAVSRWNVWFGNPAEPAYAVGQSPSHILLTFGQDGSASRCVTWQCDTVIREASVEYTLENTGDTLRIPAVGEKFTSPGGSSVFYRADIPTPVDGCYSYRTRHPQGCSDWHRFLVRNAAPGQAVEFVYLGDIQDTIGGITGSITRNIVSRHPATDCFLLGGDLIHRPIETYWDEAFRGIDSIAGSYPVLSVAGNHEYYKGLNQKPEVRFPLHFAYFLDSYRKAGYCFYTLRYGNAELFLIDSNANLFRLWQQRNALRNALAKSQAEWKIVVLHHPPYSIRKPHNNLDVRFLFVPLFDRYGVDLVLAGHEHGYARRFTRTLDGKPSVPVYTVSHCSPKQYALCIDDADRYGTGDRYYQHIALHGDTLQMCTYTIDNRLYDRIRLTKENGKTVVTDLSEGIPEQLQMPEAVARRIKPGALREYRKSVEERTRK